MQNKIRVLLWLLIKIFLIGELAISIYTRQMYLDDLMLVVSSLNNTSETSYNIIEKMNKASLLMTYEIPSIENLKVTNKFHNILLIRTNYAYPYVMKLNLFAGYFFTEMDQKEAQKKAVLNTAAANALFGSLNISDLNIEINQEDYTIVGVIDDKSQTESHIYIPDIHTDINPSTIAIRLSEDLNENIIEAKWTTLGLEKHLYQFVTLNNVVSLINECSYVSLKWVLISLFLSLLNKKRLKLHQSISFIKKLSKQFYLIELIRYHTITLLKTILYLSEMLIITIVLLNLTFDLIEFYLNLHDMTWLSFLNDNSTFSQIYLELKKLFFFAQALLIGLLLMTLLLFMETFNHNNSTSGHPTT